jgi:hypothetical protein
MMELLKIERERVCLINLAAFSGTAGIIEQSACEEKPKTVAAASRTCARVFFCGQLIYDAEVLAVASQQ